MEFIAFQKFKPNDPHPPFSPFPEAVKGELRRKWVIRDAKASRITHFRRFISALILGRAGVGVDFIIFEKAIHL
jgi:hypothetical protein